MIKFNGFRNHLIQFHFLLFPFMHILDGGDVFRGEQLHRIRIWTHISIHESMQYGTAGSEFTNFDLHFYSYFDHRKYMVKFHEC